jgi:hypothetical protein
VPGTGLLPRRAVGVWPASFGTLRSGLGSLALCGLLTTSVALTTGCNPLRGVVDDDGSDPSSNADMDPEPHGPVKVTPDRTDLTINGQPQVAQFRASAFHAGDITERASWSLSDPSVGVIAKGKLQVSPTLDHGGSVRVYANYQGQTGIATLNLRLVAPEVIDPSAPADAKDWFSGGDGGPAPVLQYPFDNTMMAPNVLQVQVQWQAGSGHTVHRVTVSGPTYERSFYLGSSVCPGGRCSFTVDDRIWSTLSHSSLGQVVTMTVSGVATRGGQVGTSESATITFSPEDTRGGLYYFSPTIRGIKRVPLGASKPVDFITNGDETGCAGCHAVSRDGKQVAIEYGSGQTNTGSTVVDGAMPSKRNFPLNRNIAWNFAWFNPAGDKLITNWSGTLKVRDPKTGNVLETVNPGFIGGNGNGAMPEWSPDGKWIAFVRELGSSPYDFELQDSGDIVVMPYNGGAFGPAVTVVAAKPGTNFHFWPSWSPDSNWLVFNTMDCGSGCQQYDASPTRLRLVRAIDNTGQVIINSPPIDLLKGTHLPHNSNNWPKFAPFLQMGRFVFVVYSANYGWGWNNGSNPQLFMFGLDLDKAKAGMDPSYQPVWLPFQDRTTGNHSAIWTTDVACNIDKDCPSEFMCVMNACVPRIG